MTDLIALKAANAARWAQAKVTRRAELVAVAKHLVMPAYKARYQAVEAKTGVPWYFIAVVHEREASQDWNTHLGQGDPLDQVTRHVPVGEPAFKTWEEGAYDALVNCPPHAARNKDWSPGGLLTMLEQYNGLGYFYHGAPSPYIWSGTDQYVRGKIKVDHGPIEPIVDPQLGCAGLLMAMMALDPSITFTGAVLTPAVPKPTVSAPPSITNPSPGSIGAFIASIFASLFKRKVP